MAETEDNNNPRIMGKDIIHSDGENGPKTIDIFRPEPMLLAKTTLGICNLLNLRIEELNSNSKTIEGLDYYCNPKSGTKIIVEKNEMYGKYLVASGIVSFEKLIEDFKSGKRNGDFMDEEFDKDGPILEISQIRTYGPPSSRRSSTELLISHGVVLHENYDFSLVNYAIINNERIDISKKTRAKINDLIRENYTKLEEIFKEQTPEFLSQHIAYTNVSKHFYLKDSTKEIKLSCHTGTPSDGFISKLVDDIKVLVQENESDISETEPKSSSFSAIIERIRRIFKK